MRIFRRLYDPILALLFGMVICAVPSLLLTLVMRPGPTHFFISALAVAIVARLSYLMIKKNRAERRFFLGEDETRP